MNSDPFRQAQRIAHLVCRNRKSAPQTYKIGQNDQGEGGRSYRAADGDDIFINEDDARLLHATNQFEFVGFETPGEQTMSPKQNTKTIQEIYDEQNAQIAEKVRLANQSPDEQFTPTTQPALQPPLGAPLDMPQGSSNLSSIPLAEIQLPTPEQAKNDQDQAHSLQVLGKNNAIPDTIDESDLRLAETILKMRALRNKK